MKRSLLLAYICLFAIGAFAQEAPVLMRVNGRNISRSEFEYSYRYIMANARIHLSPKEYAVLFSQSMLKVAAAKVDGLNTTSAFRKQQEAKLAQMAESYLIDRIMQDSCISVQYQNMKLKEHNGRVQVMQIVKYLPQTITARHLEEQKNSMDSIYRMIQNQPELDFSHWVERYSEDKEPHWIERLQATAEFENMAFGLSKGEISQPFFTPIGIHILKVMDRKELSTDEEADDWLVERVRCRDVLSRITEKLVERLKRDWQYASNQAGVEELLVEGETEKPLFTIDSQAYTGTMFRLFATSHPQSVKRQLDEFVAKSLFDYESKHIRRRHPEIRYALQKSDEDYLIKELTRQKIDLPAMNDRIGLATYFKLHSADYRWDRPRYKGAVLHCVDKKTARQAKKLLKKLMKKLPENEWANKIQQALNTSGVERVQIEQGVFAEGDNKYIDKLVFKGGDFKPIESYPFTAVVGRKQKGPDSYLAVIDQVRRDYRSYLYACWMRELEASGRVEINQEVLKTVNNN